MSDLRKVFRKSAFHGFNVNTVAIRLRDDERSRIRELADMQIRDKLFHEKQRKKVEDDENFQYTVLEIILRNIEAMTHEAEQIISRAEDVIERLIYKAATLRNWATQGAYDEINDIDGKTEEIARIIRQATHNGVLINAGEKQKAIDLIRGTGLECDENASNEQILNRLKDANRVYQDRIEDILGRIPLALKQADRFESAAGAASDVVRTAKTMLDSIPNNASPAERETRIKDALDYLKTSDNRLKLIEALDGESLQNEVITLADKKPESPALSVPLAPASGMPAASKKDIFRND